MADELISREALFKAFERAAWYNNADRDEIAEEILLQIPAVNAVVLPCEVGDTVYITEPRFYNCELHDGVQKGVCRAYELDDRFGWVVKVELEKGEPHTLYFYNFDKFGKTVFLTREEAEKALEGREDNATD